MYKKLVYKGFSSTPKYDIENKIIYGVVDDIDGFAEYESPTLSGVEQAFKDTVDDYIDGCREAGAPARPGITYETEVAEWAEVVKEVRAELRKIKVEKGAELAELRRLEAEKGAELAKLRRFEVELARAKHFFMEIDGMFVRYGDVAQGLPRDTVPYCVVRGGKGGFGFARGSLPTCAPVESEGFSESELRDIESFMRDNMRDIYDQLRGEGAWA